MTTIHAAPPQVVAYVTFVGSGAAVGLGQTIRPVDLSSGVIGSTITVGTESYPDAIAVAPRSKMAYVANYATNNVTPVNLVTGKTGKPIAAGDGPAGIAIAPNGKTAYVTDAGTSPIGDTVTPINLVTGKALTPITVGDGPQGIAITPDGSTAYVADAGAIVSGQSGPVGDTVTPINLKTNIALAPIAVGNGPLSVAITPDGATAFVTNSYSGSVSPITIANNAAGTPIETQGSPQAIAVSPDGATAYVVDSPSSVAPVSNITAIDVSSETASAPVSVPKGPTAIAIYGAKAWVVALGANALVPVDLSGAAPKVEVSIPLPGGPYALALTVVPRGSVMIVRAVPSKKHAGTKSS